VPRAGLTPASLTEPGADGRISARSGPADPAGTPGVVTGRPLTWLSLALLAAGAGWHVGALTVAGAVGLFHLGLDRLLKYGLKYDHSFGITHLGAHGGAYQPPRDGGASPGSLTTVTKPGPARAASGSLG
jgi:hypothetical protein